MIDTQRQRQAAVRTALTCQNHEIGELPVTCPPENGTSVNVS